MLGQRHVFAPHLTIVGAVDLTTCDREPIHIPGAVQPHGVLLAFDASGLRVRSANADSLGPLPRLGAQLEETHLTAALRQEIAALLADELRSPETLVVELGGALHDVVSHRSDGLLVVELEKRRVGGIALEAVAVASHRALVRIQGVVDRSTTLDVLAREVRALSGFDRVMVYRFDPDDSGVVEAEVRRDDLESFLGLHYPASDIPTQARRLYVLNPLRLIANVAYDAVPLEPTLVSTTGKPLDLSYSTLRSVSPIHIEYLRNMGVQASMSISIVIGGRLWGLIACHHMSPRLVPHSVRMSCQLMAQVASIVVERLETATESAELRRTLALQGALLDKVITLDEALTRLTAASPSLLDFIPCDGAFIVHDHGVASVGTVPSPDHIASIMSWLHDGDRRGPFDTSHAAKDAPALVPALDGLAGLLAIPFSNEERGYIVWLRAEQRHQVRWAGEPKKDYASGPLGPRLTPRGSFALWTEQVIDQSTAWTARERGIAHRLAGALHAIAYTQSRNDVVMLEQSNNELDSLAHVVSHDLRAPLRAIANLTRFIEEDLADGKVEEALVHAAGARERVAKLDELTVAALTYARAGHDKDVPRLTHVGALIDACVALLDLPPHARVEIEATVPTLNAHPVRLQQVFMNLIGNAAKYGLVGGRGVIRVGAVDIGPMWEFSVRDEGRGIDPCHFERVFQLFGRVATEEPGTGVGLAIVRRIVEANGGRAWCESSLGHGATFKFTWPKRDS